MLRDVIELREQDFKKAGDTTYVKLVLEGRPEATILRLARTSEHYKEVVYHLSRQDYIFYMQADGVCSFVKRQSVPQMWHQVRNGTYASHGALVYRLVPPPLRVASRPNLVVVFSSMPSSENYAKGSVDLRLFTKNFPTIQKYLFRNTYVLRIADINCSLGSHYVNTVNNPGYEESISELILETIERLETDLEHTVLYGVSKGGTGALLQSSRIGAACVSVDPILDLSEYLAQSDLHLLRGLREVSLLPRISPAKSDAERTLIASARVPFNFRQNSRVQNVRLIDLDYEDIKVHPDIAPKSIALQTTLINSAFMKFF